MQGLARSVHSNSIKNADGDTIRSYHRCSALDVANEWKTSLERGLATSEVERRLQHYGPNRLQGGKVVRWYEVLRRQFVDVLIAILLIAALVSLAVGEIADAVTIFAIVLLNGLLGFVQEWKAERSLVALREMLTPTCRVIRDGNEQTVDANTLVPGDIVLFESGDRIAADLRIAQSSHLRVDESALTGESISVSKCSATLDHDVALAERFNMAWMGTAATHGRGIGIVVATGGDSEFGRIASLTEGIASDTTPLQQKLAVLGRYLGIVAVGISCVVAATGWMLGKPLLEMFLTGVSLAVAVVPEGLPAVVTLTLALGVRSMVRRKALLRRLRAAEGLGAATVICTDKTGTLTQNQMTVQRIWQFGREIEVTGVGYDPLGHFEVCGKRIDYRRDLPLQELLRTAVLCNHATVRREDGVWKHYGEPTECALIIAAMKAWMDIDGVSRLVSEFAFDSTRKRMSVIEQVGDNWIAHVKGAPEVILPRCSHLLEGGDGLPIRIREMSAASRKQVAEAVESIASSGLRTLAIAKRNLGRDHQCDAAEVEQSLTLLGVVGMMDPPRPEVADAVALAGSAGIRVVMITGDSAATALAVARKIGLPSATALVGSQLERIGDAELAEKIRGDVLFARTTPEQKLRIVNTFQSQGHIVGMTGDGVNDAPALKKADIGIAMGERGTDVAKGAADIVLTDDNFSSIIGAVEEGRRQYDNIQKFVRYLLSSNTGEVVAIFLNIVMGGPLLFLPVQILWMNLVTDGLTAVALGMEPAEVDTMRRPPRDPDEPVLSGRGVMMIVLLGLYVGMASLGLFHWYLVDDDPETVVLAQTVAFTGIIVIEKVNVLNFRALRQPISAVGWFSNPWILAAISITLLLQVAAVYMPALQPGLHTVALGWREWGWILAAAFPVFVMTELVKIVASRRSRVVENS